MAYKTKTHLYEVAARWKEASIQARGPEFRICVKTRGGWDKGLHPEPEDDNPGSGVIQRLADSQRSLTPVSPVIVWATIISNLEKTESILENVQSYTPIFFPIRKILLATWSWHQAPLAMSSHHACNYATVRVHATQGLCACAAP